MHPGRLVRAGIRQDLSGPLFYAATHFTHTALFSLLDWNGVARALGLLPIEREHRPHGLHNFSSNSRRSTIREQLFV